MTFRWTPEAIEAFEARKKQWEQDGRVTTHRIAKPAETLATYNLRKRPAKPKYGNIKTEADGITFASKKEMRRWMALRLEEKAGAIKNLKRQVAYPIEINGFKVCDYIADHVYERSDVLIVEDSKGYATEVFRLKAKLMRAVHGIEIFET